jgi:hypothetical protein
MSKARDLAVVGSVAAQGLNFRNKIINGDCRIDQRNNGALLTPATNADVFPVDRWIVGSYGGGTLSSQRSTNAPAGFTNSIAVTVTGTDTSLASGDLYEITQRIEGNTVADLGFGTANARTISLSFWVRSSVTGLHSVGIENGDGTRSYVVTYTINSANTWEYKTFTVPGDTTGTWYTGNTIGLQLRWCLATGTGRVAPSANSWETGNYIAISSTANPLMGTNGATFSITGVQLEKGTSATPFEHRPYGTEEILCKRFCQAMGTVMLFPKGTYGWGSSQIPVTMRAAPSATYTMNEAPGTTNFWTGTNYVTIRNSVANPSGDANMASVSNILLTAEL